MLSLNIIMFSVFCSVVMLGVIANVVMPSGFILSVVILSGIVLSGIILSADMPRVFMLSLNV
jgi:hypothetical protein